VASTDVGSPSTTGTSSLPRSDRVESRLVEQWNGADHERVRAAR